MMIELLDQSMVDTMAVLSVDMKAVILVVPTVVQRVDLTDDMLVELMAHLMAAM